MPVFFTFMVVAACGVIYLAYKDVDSAPWNRRKKSQPANGKS